MTMKKMGSVLLLILIISFGAFAQGGDNGAVEISPTGQVENAAGENGEAVEGEQPSGLFGNQGLVMILLIGGMILLYYFMLIRPQQKREKQLRQMIDELKKGDRVITAGGIYGTVAAVKDKSVLVKVDDGTTIEFLKSSIREAPDKQPEPKKK